jgi:polyphosphate kinase 2 (PPK2 family)
MIKQKYIDLLRVEPGKKIHFKDYETGWAQSKDFEEVGKDKVKERANEILQQNREDLAQVQQLLYADDRYSLLIVFQAMDAAGKDGTIKHVMSGVNPQGCQVFSFKKPRPKMWITTSFGVT